MNKQERYRETKGKGRMIRRSERKRAQARKGRLARKIARQIRALRAQIEAGILADAMGGW